MQLEFLWFYLQIMYEILFAIQRSESISTK